MIERLGINSKVVDVQATQPAFVSAGHFAGSQTSAVFPNTSLTGETQWIGAMNAFRIARTFETQQQLLANAKGGATLADPAANPSALIHGEAGPLNASRSGEFTLIPTIKDPENASEISNSLGRQFELGREGRLISADPRAGLTEGLINPVETADVSEANSVKTQVDTTQSEFAGRPVEFRGHLVRVGDTSQFVLRVPA